ncbi:hypothetical protein HDU97_004335 [Phlyctochytrium planicorne]|nr:hypothetical protein HDU97_004335 [Phlyctochytrium planicorne]
MQLRRTLVLVAALVVLYRNRRSPGGLLAYLLFLALPKAIASKIVSYTPAKKLLGSSASIKAVELLDVPTAAFINTLRWFVGEAPLEELRGAMATSSIIQVILARLDGVKVIAHSSSNGGNGRGPVNGHWIVEKSEQVPFAAGDSSQHQVLLYFHGGGYNVNSSQSFSDHHALLIKAFNSKAAAAKSDKRLIIFSLDYPLSPENPFPAPLNSAVDTVRWLSDVLKISNIAIGGDSAGANLAIALLNKVHSDPSLKAYTNVISSSVLFSPWVDVTGTILPEGYESNDYLTGQLGRQWGLRYAGAVSARDPRISPLFLKPEDLAVAPSGTFVVYGTCEFLGTAIVRFIEMLKAKGTKNLVIHAGEGMPHDFNLVLLPLYGSQGRSKALKAINDTASFLFTRLEENFKYPNILVEGAIKSFENAYDPVTNAGGVINLGTAENKISGDLMVDKLNQPDFFKVVPTSLLYGNFRGSHALRSQIADLFNRKLKTFEAITADNIAVANGAGSIICMLSQVIADPGDVILIPSPVYGAFFWDLRSVGRVESVFVPGPASIPTLEDIERAYQKCKSEGKNVRGLLITNPGNPTGQVVPRGTVKAWLRWAAEKKIHSLVDEVYAFSVWAQPGDEGYEEFESVLSMDDLPDRKSTHVIWSFSKDFAMSGMRSGAIITFNKDVLKGFGDLAYFHGIPNVVDEALTRLLSDKPFIDSFITENNRRLREHFARIELKLKSKNIPFLKPNAGIFAWLNLSQWTRHIPDSEAVDGSKNMALFRKLLEAKVYVTPAEAFFSKEDGWFRIIHTSPWEYLDVAFSRLFDTLDEIEAQQRK